MSKLKSAGRKLDPLRVAMAIQTHDKKRQLTMDMVLDRIKTDVQFAKLALEIGNDLPENIRKEAQATVDDNLRANMEFNGGMGNALGLHMMDNNGELPEGFK